MGWLDKTFKDIVKSPLGKAAIMGGLAMTPWGKAGIAALGKGAATAGTGGMGMLSNLWAKPLVSKPLTNALMSYGLAKLMRSKNPGRAALWSAGLTLPFLGMGASAHAKQLTEAGTDASMWDVLLNRRIGGDVLGSSKQLMTPGDFSLGDINPEYGKAPGVVNMPGLENTAAEQLAMRKDALKNLNLMSGKYADVAIKTKPFGAAKDYAYWMKPELAEGTPAYKLAMERAGNKGLAGMLPDLPFNVLPTATPLGGGVYASREEREQAWERIKNERRQQLAWMYGVDPSEITGEMTNPLYDVSAPDLDWKYANQGGIMDLDAGGDVNGPGTGTSDSINAKLSDGEFVMTAKAVENFGGGSRQAGANKMYQLMNQLDPQSETPQEGMA